jgi:hypothetical protein
MEATSTKMGKYASEMAKHTTAQVTWAANSEYNPRSPNKGAGKKRIARNLSFLGNAIMMRGTHKRSNVIVVIPSKGGLLKAQKLNECRVKLAPFWLFSATPTSGCEKFATSPEEETVGTKRRKVTRRPQPNMSDQEFEAL